MGSYLVTECCVAVRLASADRLCWVACKQMDVATHDVVTWTGNGWSMVCLVTFTQEKKNASSWRANPVSHHSGGYLCYAMTCLQRDRTDTFISNRFQRLVKSYAFNSMEQVDLERRAILITTCCEFKDLGKRARWEGSTEKADESWSEV